MNNFYLSRLFSDPDKSFFLFGPRGTGKSTLVKHRFPHAVYIDLLDQGERLKFMADPNLLDALVRSQPEGQVIIIDEIQKIPDLLTTVHALIEEKRGWKFILTGSSARKLKREGVDLLGGRALNKKLHPFMAVEVGSAFNLEEALTYGMLPLRFDTSEPEETLESYVALYVEEEVKLEGLVRNIEPFARFLQTMSFSHGSVLNLTNVSRDCHVKRTTVQLWLSILEDILIGYQLPIFTARAKRELSSHPKFYFFDAGVFRAIRPQSVWDKPSEIDGMTLEGLVLQHLIAWKDYTKGKHQIGFWRTRSGVEVDFILMGPLGLWAIEVKNSREVRSGDLRSLNAFLDDYPEAKALLIYRGQKKLEIGRVLCLPCEEFLMNLKPNFPLNIR